MYNVKLHSNRTLFVVALGAGLAAVIYFPPLLPDKIIEMPTAALYLGELGLALMAALLFYENASISQVIKLAAWVLGFSMAVGAVGNFVSHNTQLLSDSVVLMNWVQLIIMNVAGTLSTITLFKLETQRVEITGLVRQPEPPPRPEPADATPSLKSQTPEPAAAEGPAVVAEGRPTGEFVPPMPGAMPAESAQDILDGLDISRIMRLEKSLNKEPVSLETLFKEENQAAKRALGAGTPMPGPSPASARTESPGPTLSAEEARVIELTGAQNIEDTITGMPGRTKRLEDRHSGKHDALPESMSPDASKAVSEPTAEPSPAVADTGDLMFTPEPDESTASGAGELVSEESSWGRTVHKTVRGIPITGMTPEDAAPAAESADQDSATMSFEERIIREAAARLRDDLTRGTEIADQPAKVAEESRESKSEAASGDKPAESMSIFQKLLQAEPFDTLLKPADVGDAPSAVSGAGKFDRKSIQSDNIFESTVDDEVDDIFKRLVPESAHKEVSNKEPEAEESHDVLFEETVVNEEVDDIFKRLVPAAAQREVNTEILRQLRADLASQEAPNEKGEASPAVADVADEKEDKKVAEVRATAEVKAEAESKAADTKVEAKSKAADTKVEAEPKAADTKAVSEVKSDADTKAADQEKAAPAAKKVEAQEDFDARPAAQTSAAAAEKTRDKATDLIGSLSASQPETAAKDMPSPAEATAPAANEGPVSAPVLPAAEAKEVKEFGRLAAGGSTPTESEETGTMKTIGKMLIDVQAVENIIKSAKSGVSGPTTARIVSLEKGEDIRILLEKITAQQGVEGCVLVGHDGLVIASNMPSEADKDTLGALSMAVLSHSSLTAEKLQLSKLRQTILYSGDKLTILCDVPIGVLGVFGGTVARARLNKLLAGIADTVHGDVPEIPTVDISGGISGGHPALSAAILSQVDSGPRKPVAPPAEPVSKVESFAPPASEPGVPSKRVPSASASTTPVTKLPAAESATPEKDALPDKGKPAASAVEKDTSTTAEKAAAPVEVAAPTKAPADTSSTAPRSTTLTEAASQAREEVKPATSSISREALETPAPLATSPGPAKPVSIAPVAAELVRDLIASLAAAPPAAPTESAPAPKSATREESAAKPVSKDKPEEPKSTVSEVKEQTKPAASEKAADAKKEEPKKEEPVAKTTSKDKTPEAAPPSTPPKEVKEFGRLSAKASTTPSPESGQGSMKTIGKMLIDAQAVANIIKAGETRNAGLTTARVISAARGEGIRSLLANIDSYPGVAGSLIVGHDGLVIASTLGPGMDRDLLGAMCSSIHSTTDLATKKLDLGVLRQSVYLSKDKLVCLTEVEVGVLAVFCDDLDHAKIDGLLEAIEQTVHG